MTEFRYGPVELHLVGFEGERPDPGVIQALTELLESGLLRLLDVVLIARSDDGDVSVTEIDDQDDLFGDLVLEAVGLAGDEDVAEFAELVPPGGSAALFVLELAYARTLASRLDASGAVLLRSERIPAPIVNAIVDATEGE
jgi:uncharacterized membrane protein